MKNVQSSTDLLWNGLSQPKRGPRPTLSLPVIARAGIELADEDGLTAVTMEAVAQRLGLTKMALYRYVPGKSELLALMVEVALGQPSARSSRSAKSANGWRPALRAWALTLFKKFSEHPWSLEATLGARAIGPNEVAWLESALAALADTGLLGTDKLDIVATLIGHVRHLVQQMSRSGVGAGEHSERVLLDAFRALTEGKSESFPALSAVLSERAPKHREGAALDFGLNCILDGVQTLIASGANKRRRSRRR